MSILGLFEKKHSPNTIFLGKKVVLGKCKDCGNNPVPHFINWYFESLNILFTPLRQFLFFNRLSTFFVKLFRNLQGGYGLFLLGKFLRILKLQNDISKCKVERAKVLWQEAIKRGIVMQEVLLFGRGIDVYLATSANQLISQSVNQLIFSGLPRPEGFDGKILDSMDDKAYLKRKFNKAGLPVPKGGSAWTFKQALNIFNSIIKPVPQNFFIVPSSRHFSKDFQKRSFIYGEEKLEENNKEIGQSSFEDGLRPSEKQWYINSVIVKPRTGSRGRHTTTFVYNQNQFKKAYKSAKKLNFWVVVEQQLKGPVYRATLVNFELCGVLRGDPPCVLGDGKKSISELIAEKNLQKLEKVKEVTINPEVVNFLNKQNLTVDSIPKLGERVDLSEKIGVNYGGSSKEELDICHSDNKELFVKAAKVLGDPLVGFDFIIPDITKSYKEQIAGFIEANSLPFIQLHHQPLLGIPQNVAAKVWDMVFSTDTQISDR